MNEEELEDIKNTIKHNDYKDHYHLCTHFEVEYIDNLVKEYEKTKQDLDKANKVINDLEEWAANKLYELEYDNVGDEDLLGYLIQRRSDFKDVLDKIKELKGDDKDE